MTGGARNRAAASTTPLPGSSSPTPLLAHRYQRLGVIGRGATGTVYRAADRLTGRLVALKTVATDPKDDANASSVTEQSARTGELLAREFRLLAGLRHPNVIASLDYGLDDTGRPFFTMDLQDRACTLREAAEGQAVTAKVDLLVQLLHALAYLHRRGLVHRDVKPENALCVGGVVKLIDFGLAVPGGQAEAGSRGTLAYAAPEILRGAPVDERADLYAVGVIAYEILAGSHPFEASSPAKLLRSVFGSSPDFDKPGLEPALAPVLRRLLARERADRFGDALEVIAALASALGRPLPLETISTRESFLHGAALIGREAELERLVRALPETASDDRRSVLVGGESGIGKSRLLEELAVEAMVRGVVVLRGQALREGSRPYEPWRGVLRLLALSAEPGELEAAVLGGVVPGIARLLGRPVPAPPELDPEATHLRLVRVIETLLRRCDQPMLIVLEDIQWAGNESLKLFARVQTIAPELRLLMVASYRSDERPGLAGELPGADDLVLERLPAGAVARLCASMLGERSEEPATRQELLELVSRESDGNVFRVVEIMRALAYEAGGLERVGTLPLAERLLTGRVEGLVHRRVERLSGSDRALLQTAAVAGRELDLEILASLHPDLDVEACAARAAAAAVLSSVQGRWWFAHDKLRDALIEALPDEDRRLVHGRLANAILAVSPTQASTLAHHFGAAGETRREREFASLAGDQFLRSGAYHEAIPYLRRALELTAPGDPELARAILERQLGEALFRCGQLTEAREALAAALSTLGRPLPASRPRFVLALLGQATAQLGLRARRRSAPAPAATDVERFEEAVLAYTQLSRLAHHESDEELVLLVTLTALNLSERGQLRAHHARLSAVMGAVMGLLPLHRGARFYFATAQALGEELDDPSLHAFVLAHQGYYEAGVGEWQACREHLERSMELYDQTGDVRLWEESVSILAYALFFKGEVQRSLELFRALERSGEERVDRQIMSWGLTNRIKLLVRSGPLANVDELVERVDAILVDGITKTVRDGALVELELARGSVEAAGEAAGAAAKRLERSAPRSFMACSTYAVIAEALLARWAAARAKGAQGEARDLQRAAARANRALAKIARVFPIVEPARLLHAGTFEALSGRSARARALWQKAAELAATRELPFEEALALGALARRPEAHDRAGMQERARALLDRMGALLAHRRAHLVL